MQEKTFFQSKAFRFRRYCRAGYAAFNSLRRVVNIGCLATYIADKQLSKSVGALVVLTLMLSSAAMAQDDDPTDGMVLPTLSVVATADAQQASPDAVATLTKSDLASLAVSTVGELLEHLPGIDLRSRGGNDVQGDLTMRGGTFDQMAILINGVNVTDAQTGHHSMDLPLDLSVVDRVEVIPAAALLRYGLTSFCGAVNIVTSSGTGNRTSLNLRGGSYGTLGVSAFLRREQKGWQLSTSAAFDRSDGYRENTDYVKSSLHLQAFRPDASGSWLFQLGGQTKDFGSMAFYSIAYPDQFESTRTLLATMTRLQRVGLWQMELVGYGRLHSDRFELFRDGYVVAPAWYGGHNYHLSGIAGSRVRGSRSWLAGTTSLGAEFRYDGIVSNVLGDSLDALRPVWGREDAYYSVGVERISGVLFADHQVRLGKSTMGAGALVLANNRGDKNFGFSLNADRPLGEHALMALSLGRSFRLPTFNDLYYHSVTQVNDPYLKSESSLHADAVLNYRRGPWHGVASLYARRGDDVIDWVSMPPSTVWYSMNHARIDAAGFDLQCIYRGHGWLERVDVVYSYCTMNQKADDFVSKYALEYLRNKIGSSLALRPVPRMRVKLMGDYYLREGSYVDADGNLMRYDPVLLLNAGVEYRLKSVTLSLDGRNLLDRRYCEYGGVPQMGFSLMAGVRYDR